MSRARKAPKRRALEWTGGAIVAIAIAALAWIFLIYPASVRSRRGDGAPEEMLITIENGARIDTVAEELERIGAIDHASYFAFYARLLGAEESLREGEIRLRPNMSVRSLLMRIAEGYGEVSLDIVIPEGFHRFAVARRLARWDVCSEEAFLAATTNRALLDELDIPGPSAEGYLFPDTYTFVTHTEPEEVLRRFVSNYRARTAEAFAVEGPAHARLERLSFSPHDMLTLASVVEKEAVMRDEQPIIAGVFVNRLESETFLPLHRLQADPTVSYGCLVHPELLSCAGFDGRRITRAMLDDSNNDYNSYRRAGLPPGPICSPGLPAIRAVLSHTQHDYLYFVARGGRRHAFSATLDTHNESVADLRERERRAAEAE